MSDLPALPVPHTRVIVSRVSSCGDTSHEDRVEIEIFEEGVAFDLGGALAEIRRHFDGLVNDPSFGEIAAATEHQRRS